MHTTLARAAAPLQQHGKLTLSPRLKQGLPLFFAVVVFLLTNRPLQARPLIGAPILASGKGSSHVQILQPAAAFTSEIWLVAPVRQFIGLSTEVGKVVQLGHFPVGTELVFAIYVQDTGDTFFTGLATRNPDGAPHAAVEFINPVQAIVGFEDLFGGGDLDYDDVQFRVKR